MLTIGRGDNEHQHNDGGGNQHRLAALARRVSGRCAGVLSRA